MHGGVQLVRFYCVHLKLLQKSSASTILLKITLEQRWDLQNV